MKMHQCIVHCEWNNHLKERHKFNFKTLNNNRVCDAHQISINYAEFKKIRLIKSACFEKLLYTYHRLAGENLPSD